MTIRGRAQQRGQALNGGNWYGQWGDPSVIPPNSAYNKSAAGVVVNERSVLSLLAIFACMRVLGDSVAGLETHAYTKVYNAAGEIEEREVPLPPVVAEPYVDVDAYDGDFKFVASLGLNGNHFLHVVDRDEFDNPTLMEILNPSAVKVERIKGVKCYRLGAVGPYLDPNDVIHVPWVSLAGGDVGMNPIEVGAMGLGTAIAANEYAARWFAQGASPSGILSVDKPLTKPDALRIKAELMTDHGGLAQSHVPMVLDSNARWQQIGMAPEASQLLQSRQFSRDEVIGFYGVPPHLVGDASDKGMVWGKMLQEMVISFSMFTLDGYTKRHARMWTKLCPRGIYVRKNTSDLFKSNDTMVAQLINSLRNTSIISPNEGRQMVNRPRSDEDGADSLFAPLNSAQSDWFAQEKGAVPNVADVNSDQDSGGGGGA